MKKALVTLAVGESYEEMESIGGPFRRAYAERHGWDYLVLSEPPDDLEQLGRRRAFFNQKLRLPQMLLNYELAVYVDCDTVFNAGAECLSSYTSLLPAGGFCACQTLPHWKRDKLFPHWGADYYTGMLASLPDSAAKHELELLVKEKERYINGGLLLFRPAEVAETWDKLAELDLSLTGEQKLNLFETQQGRVGLLPAEWHVVWYYHKVEYYPFLLKQGTSMLARAWNKALELALLSSLEQTLATLCIKNNKMVHFAFDSKPMVKLKNLSPENLEKSAAQAIKQLRFYFYI